MLRKVVERYEILTLSFVKVAEMKILPKLQISFL